MAISVNCEHCGTRNSVKADHRDLRICRFCHRVQGLPYETPVAISPVQAVNPKGSTGRLGFQDTGIGRFRVS